MPKKQQKFPIMASESKCKQTMKMNKQTSQQTFSPCAAAIVQFGSLEIDIIRRQMGNELCLNMPCQKGNANGDRYKGMHNITSKDVPAQGSLRALPID